MSLIGSLTSGVSAMRSFTKGLEVIGNDIANVNTIAFKSSSVSFADSFSNTLRSSAPASGTSSNQSAVQIGTGVVISQISTDFTQGALSGTGLNTDLGISGNGFFLVKDPASGTLYATRAGNFRIDDTGYLVTTDGYRLQGAVGGTSSGDPSGFGDIKLGTPPTGAELKSWSIGTDGGLTEFYSDGTSVTTNRLLLQTYRDTSALVKQGSNLYTGFDAAGIIGATTPDATGNTPGTQGLGQIKSGELELSNVDLTNEFANMITTQRSFQASSRIITVSDSVLDDIVNLKRS